MATLTRPTPRVNARGDGPPHAGDGTPLRDSRSVKDRSYRCDLLSPGTVRLIDGTPADAVVTIGKGQTVCRYLIAVTGYSVRNGLLTRWQKPDGTLYDLNFDGFKGTCDCPACTFEATHRADRRKGDTFGSYGCCKLDTLAELVKAGQIPDPRLNQEGDAAGTAHARPGARAAG